MQRNRAALAVRLDFGDLYLPSPGIRRPALTLAPQRPVPTGSQKYHELDMRRRRAQIRARRVLGVL
jgi:hypothetical protein